MRELPGQKPVLPEKQSIGTLRAAQRSPSGTRSFSAADGNRRSETNIPATVAGGGDTASVVEDEVRPAPIPCARSSEGRYGTAVGGFDLQRPVAAARAPAKVIVRLREEPSPEGEQKEKMVLS